MSLQREEAELAECGEFLRAGLTEQSTLSIEKDRFRTSQREREEGLCSPAAGSGKTKLTDASLDVKLKTMGTQRKWDAVLTLVKMMGE